MNATERQRFEHLMMAAVDGELAADERHEFEHMLERHQEWRAEYEHYKKLKEVTSTMKFQNPPQEVWDSYWLRVYNRIERGLAWILFSIGAIIILTYAIYHSVQAILADTTTPVVLKLGILGLAAGMVILLVSIVREKLFLRKTDKYKEVQR